MKNLFSLNEDFMSFHPKYGYWGTPNFQKTRYFDEYSKEVVISHDQFGNRKINDNSYSPTTRPTIMFLGGSHTWGAGIDNHQTYPALIQEKFSYNCLNFGQCSVGLDQMVMVLVDHIKKIQPEHVVIELHPWVVHRVLRKSAIGFPKPYLKLEGDKVSIKKISKLNQVWLFRKINSEYAVFEKALEEYVAEINLLNLSKNKYQDPLFMVWNQNYYKDMYRIIQFLLQTAKNVCHENRVKLLIVLGPTQQELEFLPKVINLIDPRIPRIRLIDILFSEKISFLDLEPRFEGIYSNKDQGIYSDGHINQNGHNIFADSIIEKIKLND